MLSLDKPQRPIDTQVLRHEGGFAWWYADVCGPNGETVVLIWSAGLPFLPEQDAGAPIHRPSLNVAVYDNDRETFYLLQEHPEDRARFTASGGHIGSSTLSVGEQGGVYTLRAHLDAPIPGTGDRLKGTITVQGRPAVHDTRAGSGPHRWTPLCASAVGQVDLEVGGETLARFEGHAYHDRNQSTRPLTELGIEHWIWGRARFDDGERILYALWPEGGGAPDVHWVVVRPDGTTEVHAATAELSGWRLGLYGMPWYRSIRVHTPEGIVETALGPLSESGPFYLRSRLVMRMESQQAIGVAEFVRPSRVDRWWMRPFVRMRVHKVGGANAWLLTWFSGRRADRLGRLLRPAAPMLGGA
jgi:hypothetical protein